jgi:hypothetical protein
MPYINSVEEIGFERGVRSLILRVLKHRFGSIPDRTIDRVNKLSITRLESLGEALLDFSEIDDLTTWLDNHSG